MASHATALQRSRYIRDDTPSSTDHTLGKGSQSTTKRRQKKEAKRQNRKLGSREDALSCPDISSVRATPQGKWRQKHYEKRFEVFEGDYRAAGPKADVQISNETNLMRRVPSLNSLRVPSQTKYLPYHFGPFKPLAFDSSYLPFQTQDLLLRNMIRIVEQSCYHFTLIYFPDVLEANRWTIPGSIQLQEWWIAVKDHEVPCEALDASQPLSILIRHIRHVGNAAIYKYREIPITSVKQMLWCARSISVALGDEEGEALLTSWHRKLCKLVPSLRLSPEQADINKQLYDALVEEKEIHSAKEMGNPHAQFSEMLSECIVVRQSIEARLITLLDDPIEIDNNDKCTSLNDTIAGYEASVILNWRDASNRKFTPYVTISKGELIRLRDVGSDASDPHADVEEVEADTDAAFIHANLPTRYFLRGPPTLVPAYEWYSLQDSLPSLDYERSIQEQEQVSLPPKACSHYDGDDPIQR